MLFFATIWFRASTNISLNLFLNICLFWLLHLFQKFFYFILLIYFLFSIASSIKFWLLQLILYLNEYVLLCYAIFDINIAKNSWQTHLNQTLPFKDSFLLISVLCIFPYSILSSPRKDQHFPKFVRGAGQRLFIFQNFTTY